MEKPKLGPYILLALGFIGIADTLYLSIYAFNNILPSCALSGCDIVLSSVYSKFLGIPLAYIGLVYYVYLTGLALLLAFDPYSKGLRFGVLVYTSIGLLLSIGFEVFQATVIHALCMYCGISAITTLLLFLTAWWHYRSTSVSAI